MTDYIEYIFGMDRLYILLMFTILLIGTLATYHHKRPIPLLWALGITGLMFSCYITLYPILVGWIYTTPYSTFWVCSLLFTLSWLAVIGLTLKNFFFVGSVAS